MVKLLIELFFTFFKIGMFTIGGGYAMIPLIQQEIVDHGWMTFKETVDMIAVSEMTPGPFAINSATFVGVKTGGIIGAAVATLGVVLPSFIIVVLVAKYSTRFRNEPMVQSALYGLRPAVIGLIAASAFSIATASFFTISNDGSALSISGLVSNIGGTVDFKSIFIFIVAMIAGIKYKVHPILLIVLSGVLGIILYAI